MSKEYDFIIVGGGSSGCVLAAHLVQNNYSVLLLERGKRQEDYPNTLKTNDWGKVFSTKALRTICSNPIKALNNLRTLIAVGNVLGGGSSINSMMYFRAPKEFWTEFSAYPEWSFERITQLYEDVEKTILPDRPPKMEHSEAFIKAAKEAGYEMNDDFEANGCFGVGYNLTSSRNGERRSSYTAFIKPHLDNKNLEIKTETLVTRVIFNEDKAAVGVEYLLNGKLQKALISEQGEVILSAGALETPKILMLSGVGPKTHLEQFNIECLINNEEVGQNLIDQPDCPIAYRSKKPMPDQVNQIQACAFASSSAVDNPNLQLLFFPGNYNVEMSMMGLRGLPNWIVKYPWVRTLIRGFAKSLLTIIPPLKTFLQKAYVIMPCLMHSKNRGGILLSSNNPEDNPIVDLDYLSSAEDMAALKEGLEFARKIGESEALNEWRHSELIPGKKADLEKHLRTYTGTTYHYAGTCRMGPVVDQQLRVKGTKNLRVADSSILPKLPIVTPNATCLLIGRNAAQMILDEKKASG